MNPKHKMIYICTLSIYRSALVFEMSRRNIQSRCIDTNEFNHYGPGPRIIEITNDNLREVALSQHTETKV